MVFEKGNENKSVESENLITESQILHDKDYVPSVSYVFVFKVFNF